MKNGHEFNTLILTMIITTDLWMIQCIHITILHTERNKKLKNIFKENIQFNVNQEKFTKIRC